MDRLVKDVVSKLGNHELVKDYLGDNTISGKKLSRKEKDKLYSYIDNFTVKTGEEVLAAWLLLETFGEKRILPYMRRKGVFRYSASWEYTLWSIDKVIEFQDVIPIEQFEIDYLKGKKANKWLSIYYKKTEKAICNVIDQRYKRRQRNRIGNFVYETSLAFELMVYVEMLYRLVYNEPQKIYEPRNKDVITGYSIENIEEAISYLLHLCKERIPVPNDRGLWIDTDYILSSNITELVVEAAKFKWMQEMEVQADCLGYSYDKSGMEMTLYDKNDNDKCLRTGYSKFELQRMVKCISIAKKYKNARSFNRVVDMFYNEAKDYFFKKANYGTTMERYIMIFPEPLLDMLTISERDGRPILYEEEVIELAYNSSEMFVSTQDMLSKRVTEDCTVLDVILFKRLFYIISGLKSRYFNNDIEDRTIMARSLVPLFGEKELVDYIGRIIKSKEKTRQLLQLFTYDGKGVLDIQYTPIIKFAGKYYIMTEVLTRSDLIRNAIVHGRQMGFQVANTDGDEDPLEKYALNIFKNSKYSFGYRPSVKYNYDEKNGEVDVVIWTDSFVYLIECKNNINPTSSYEMRTTLDYIEKACMQLELSEKAFNDIAFRDKYFKGWGIKDNNQKVIPFILLGNRVFCATNTFEFPIRHVYELEQMISHGFIDGSLGKWSLWEKKKFKEQDLVRYVSKADLLGKSFYDGMFPIELRLKCDRTQVVYKTFAFDYILNALALDNNLTIIDKKEDARKELLNKHGEGIKSFEEYRDIVLRTEE